MSLLQDLQAGKLHDFHGGIHPPERKAPANQHPIVEAGLPEELVLQIRQHIGQPARLRVKVGDRVLKGERLTDADNPMMIPVHAPTSGTITAIERRPLCHPSGLDGDCVILTPDGQDQWRPRYPMNDIDALGADVLLERIHEAGITGLGGAGFPAHVKLRPRKKAIETLIINGVECEPYISADDRLMREHADDILQGVAILRHIVRPQLTVIAVEDNKPEALAALRDVNRDENVLVVAVPTKYPSGGEKQLIEILTGQQVPRNGLPADIGIVVQNVGTAFAVKRAVLDDEPLIQRVVTLAGDGFGEKCNAWVRIGTPVRYLLKRFGFTPGPEPRIIMGGPMMGFTLHTAAAPVIKGSNCILAPGSHELSPPVEEQPCIRCSQCADACPASLLPQQLYWHARANEHDKLNSHHLFDCIECGACAWVCPSQIPLVQYYRVAKADIRQAQREAEQAERAKQRFEARQARLEREKAERLARQQKAAAERKARMEEQVAAGGEDPVAAALARVKARQQAEGSDDMAAARAARKEEARRNRERKAAESATGEAASPAPAENKADAVAAAVARAKARKAAQAATTGETPAVNDGDDKKSAVAAAVARAKARKAAQAAEQSMPDAAPAETSDDDKKAAVAAAVARAKARKAAQAAGQSTPDAAQAEKSDDDKKAAVAAAVARAKARKAAQAAEQSTPDAAPAEKSDDDKKAAVAAAVARAKARKAAQAAEQSEPVPDAPPAEQSDDDKKAAIRAAVARAKARKAAAASSTSKPEDES
ncbi:RnfABCDGE type electron transport complex subunit C [Oceanimonas sp. GK1]|uniref:electron transport complex subunit RsxC n=1 Tax=Oceanimonas sp. (strain GK1 / IBRC-M 10197) TaxID=511062 RepID=UPI000249524A|nr:electron transport complex subunit RsxC [Oceanimonas sp. GK1]AEY01876.1 RnfABCDGE type electron transport complex subunit C [Oceanimonas sp. GK1]